MVRGRTVEERGAAWRGVAAPGGGPEREDLARKKRSLTTKHCFYMLTRHPGNSAQSSRRRWSAVCRPSAGGKVRGLNLRL